MVQAAESTVDALVALFDDTGLDDALALSQRLRAAGLNVETQLEARKLGKQFQYADRAGIRHVVVRGEDEVARGVATVKDLRGGEQFGHRVGPIGPTGVHVQVSGVAHSAEATLY